MTSYLAIWAVVGPLLVGGITYTSMRAHEYYAIKGAVAGEALHQLGLCAKRLTDQALTVEVETLEGIGLAGAAADSSGQVVAETVVATCKSDTACRDRGVLP